MGVSKVFSGINRGTVKGSSYIGLWSYSDFTDRGGFGASSEETGDVAGRQLTLHVVKVISSDGYRRTTKRFEWTMDMTPMTEELTKDKEVAMQRLSPFLGEQAQFVYELMCAEKFRYDRLLADEGQRMLELLKNYCKERGGKGNGQETL